MDSDGKFWMSIWSLVAIFILGFMGVLGYFSKKEVEAYTKNGYCQVQRAGSTTYMWQKCEQIKR